MRVLVSSGVIAGDVRDGITVAAPGLHAARRIINYGNPDFEHGFDGLKRIRRIYGTTRIYGFVKKVFSTGRCNSCC
jgi:hypothetical protein